MKRLLLNLLCVLFAYPCFAGEPIQLARMSPWVAGSVSAAAVSYADCSQIPSGSAFVWYGDYASDTDKACYGSTATDGTLGAGISVVASNSDPGTASPTSGGNVLKFDSTTNEYIQWTNTDNDIFDPDEGEISVDVYIAEITGYTTIQFARTDVNNIVEFRIASDGTVRFDRTGTSTRVYIDSTNKLSDATWTNIKLRWSVANNKQAIKIGANEWQEHSSGTVTAYTGTLSYLKLNCSLSANTIYVDNFTIKTAYSE